MECFVGIDVGTSSARAVAIDMNGQTLATGQCEYDIIKPELNQAEQNMDHLWNSTVEAIKQMLAKAPELKNDIKGIGFSGQMHGLVMVDKDMKPIRNAIIWADQRSAAQIQHIYETVPESEFGKVFNNRLSTGFLLPSLVWVKENEPENYDKI